MKKYRLTNLGKVLILSSTLLVVFSLIMVSTKYSKIEPVENKIEPVFNDSIKPVMQDPSTILHRPYVNGNVKILKDFYSYLDSSEEQENSLIYYESTYMPNSSVIYGGVDDFEVTAVLDGVVLSIKEDGLIGNIIEISHDNDVVSVYQGVKDIKVSLNQVVSQGDVIASAGTSNLNKEYNNHLMFELIHKDEILDPEDYYMKDTREL